MKKTFSLANLKQQQIDLTKSFYENQLNKVLVEFDAYEVLEENNNQLLIKKLNDENNQTNWVEKRQFLK